MMKIVFFALLMCLGLSCESRAQPIRVLISISKEKVSQRFANLVERRLVKYGYESTGYSIEENADQYSLYQTLNDPTAQALIWISHGATPRLTRKMKRQLSGMSGMSAQPELIDYRGDNVAPIFKNYSKNLKYVAVVGCNSQQILDYVESDLATDDNIDKFIPTKKVIAQFAIRKAVKFLRNVEIDEQSTAIDLPNVQGTLSIERSIPADMDESLIRPLRIMIGNDLVGVIPVMKPGETRTFSIHLSDNDIKQVKLETGQPIMTPIEKVQFGNLKLTLPSGVTMKPFSKNDGTPFGLNFRLFILP